MVQKPAPVEKDDNELTAALEDCALYLILFSVSVPVILAVSRNVNWAGKRGFSSFATLCALTAGRMVWGLFRHTPQGHVWRWSGAAAVRLTAIAVMLAYNAFLYHKLFQR